MVSARLKSAMRGAARSRREAEEFAGIAVDLEKLAQRVKVDAGQALQETDKLGGGLTSISFCACGGGIETGECSSGGRCHRGLVVNLVG